MGGQFDAKPAATTTTAEPRQGGVTGRLHGDSHKCSGQQIGMPASDLPSAAPDCGYIFGMKREDLAAVSSFVVPGIGQFYNGDILRGLFWLIITPGFWVGSGGTLGWVCHLISAYTAHQRAVKRLPASSGVAS